MRSNKKLSLIAATMLTALYAEMSQSVNCSAGNVSADCDIASSIGGTLTFTGAAVITVNSSSTGSILTNTNNQGTLTFGGGSRTITGAAGGVGALLSVLNTGSVGLASEAITGNVYVTTLNLKGLHSSLTLGGASTTNSIGTINFSAAGTVSLNSDTKNEVTTAIAYGSNNGTTTVANSVANTIAAVTATNAGTLTFSGAGTVVGGIGANSSNRLALLNAGATSSTVTLSGTTYVTNLKFTGTGTVNLNAAGTGTVSFSGNNGAFSLAAGKTWTGSVTTATTAGTGYLTMGAGATVTGNAGAANMHLSTIDVTAGGGTIQGNIGADTYNLGESALTGGGDGTVVDLTGSTINVSVWSDGSYGRIINTDGDVLSSGTMVALTVDGYVPNNARLVIARGGMSNGVDSVDTITVTGSNNLTFVQDTTDTASLVLVATRPVNATETFQNAIISTSNIGSDLSTILYQVDNLTAVEANQAYTQMQPVCPSPIQITNAIKAAEMNIVSSRVMIAAQGKTDNSGLSAGGDVVDVKNPILENAQAWLKGFGTFAKQKDLGVTDGYENNILGGMLGLDGQYSKKTNLGGAIGYASSNIKFNDSRSAQNINSYQGTVYGLTNFNAPWYLDGAVSFSWNHYKATRAIVFSGVNRVAFSEYDGQQYGLSSGVGYQLQKFGWTVLPRVGFQYSALHLGSYTEINAGDLSLNVDTQNYEALQSDAGIRVNRGYKVKSVSVLPELRARLTHDFIADAQNMTSSFTGGGVSFVTKGLRPSRSVAAVGAGLGLQFKNRWSFVADYDVAFKKSYNAQNVMVTGKMKF